MHDSWVSYTMKNRLDNIHLLKDRKLKNYVSMGEPTGLLLIIPYLYCMLKVT